MNPTLKSTPTPKPPRRSSIWRKLGYTLLFIVATLVVAGVTIGVRMITAREGERTGKGSDNWIQALSDLKQITTDPKAGFPGKDRITILCMGIDDNWTDKDMVYTKGARTDTLFMLGLDLNTKHVSMLSIPRDSYVPIAGTERSNKINAAYSIGGPKMAMDTVGQLLGVQPDYYIVIKIDGTATMVNALGGVDVNVEHELNYDDNWGHLHVHLKPGFQHLNGPDAVGFARFRHGNKGVTPEDGDQRRIYRQHELMRAMVEKIKSAGNLIKPNYLVDTAMSCIATDLSRTQLFDLGAIFHSVKQEEIQTAQVSGTDARSSSGAYIMRLDDEEVKLLSDWLLRGDALAGRALTPVVVVNGTKVSGLAASTADYLKSLGYSTIKVGSYSKKEEVQKSSIVDGGVANRGAAAEAASFLGIPATSLSREIVKPNKYGWAPPPAVTIYLGTDYAAHPQGAAPVPAGSTQPPSSGT